MTTTLQSQVLINARALIADRMHWTSGTLACTSDGQPVAWDDRLASQWCAQGAIYRAACDLVGDPKEAMHISAPLINSICPLGSSLLRGHLTTINDRWGHAAVLALFDKALEPAE
jgi:hypothetical protein